MEYNTEITNIDALPIPYVLCHQGIMGVHQLFGKQVVRIQSNRIEVNSNNQIVIWDEKLNDHYIFNPSPGLQINRV